MNRSVCSENNKCVLIRTLIFDKCILAGCTSKRVRENVMIKSIEKSRHAGLYYCPAK